MTKYLYFVLLFVFFLAGCCPPRSIIKGVTLEKSTIQCTKGETLVMKENIVKDTVTIKDENGDVIAVLYPRKSTPKKPNVHVELDKLPGFEDKELSPRNNSGSCYRTLYR